MSRDRASLDDFLREAIDLSPDALETLSVLAIALGDGSPPPAGARERVLGAAVHAGRFDDLAGRVAALMDVTTDRARAMLDGIDERASWGPSPLPDVGLYDVSGGPSVANAITGFIRIPGGREFPPHTHLGDEVVLVVQGHFVDADGREYGPGDEIPKPAGSTHTFRVKPGPDLVYLAIVHEGLEILGQVFRPGDPRI